ncbi:sulfite exporter TauE/SafE family protein [Actinocrispum wychmicini]|uniref:Probable membrane transporter protein n=1 Tax=Actinocrispum wychmicini TaxID=1213861 RepID=A0A4R2IWV5_9PSEU|nr:sulfite exporter TauE/SafE family protein [Actinocrispum wychmicini]TCO49767.1 hypothetical protein EV192_114137 [Actinocrispum wychmicini]
MTIAILVFGGVLAGILNVAAAGGSLLSFLTLSLVGVPPLAANATNLAATPASFLGGFPNAWHARKETRLGFLSAVAGTAVGVWLVNSLTADVFRRIAPILLVVAALVLILQPWLGPRVQRRAGTSETHPAAMTVSLFGTGVYAGGFGAGVGILVLVVLAYTTPWPWRTLNGSKNVVCLMTSLVGLAAFAMTGLVVWPLAAVLAGSMAVGGLLGHWITRHVPGELLRGTVAVMAAFGAGHMAAS